MIDAFTPPTERDLPPGHATKLRMLVTDEHVMRNRHSSRRWVAPIAAAATVATVGTAIAVISGTSVHHDAVDVPVHLDDATALQKCSVHMPGARLLVRFTDTFGDVAAVGTATNYGLCHISLSGDVDAPGPNALPSGPDPIARGFTKIELLTWGNTGVETPGTTCYRVASADVASASSASSALHGSIVLVHDTPVPSGPDTVCVHGGRSGNEIFGRISPAIASLTVAWAGRPSVEAAVRDGYFVAREIDEQGQAAFPIGADIKLQAYDASGQLVTAQTQKN